MLTKAEEQIVSKYVKEYLDALRMDVHIFGRIRVITEQSDSRVVVVDKDFLIDTSKDYEVLLKHPLEEDFFIPREIDLYVTQIDLDFDRKEGFQITNFVDAGVIDFEAVSIDDPEVSDKCLGNLVRYMCFDLDYQKSSPEVKALVDEFFLSYSGPGADALKARLRPFLGIEEA
jgi:hypothetical protein